jgi:hypothetical protein
MHAMAIEIEKGPKLVAQPTRSPQADRSRAQGLALGGVAPGMTGEACAGAGLGPHTPCLARWPSHSLTDASRSARLRRRERAANSPGLATEQRGEPSGQESRRVRPSVSTAGQRLDVLDVHHQRMATGIEW